MLSGRLLSFPPFFEVLLAKERQKQKISPPKSEARRLWTPAWKGNERIAPIKMQGAYRHSGVALNGRAFIFRTLKWPEPCPREFREARKLLAHLDDLVTYFIVHRGVTREPGVAPDPETVPETLRYISNTAGSWTFN